MSVAEIVNFIASDFYSSPLWLIHIDQTYGTSEIRISTPNRYSYRYLTAEKIPAPNTTQLTFQVLACNDAHIALKPAGRSPLEVVLGGWRNTRSCLRTEIQGNCRARRNGAVLDCRQFKTFWIDWSTRQVKVGRVERGKRVRLLTYRLRAALSEVEVGISTGFGASGAWVFEGVFPFYTLYYRDKK
jgi:hypothetical protein